MPLRSTFGGFRLFVGLSRCARIPDSGRASTSIVPIGPCFPHPSTLASDTRNANSTSPFDPIRRVSNYYYTADLRLLFCWMTIFYRSGTGIATTGLLNSADAISAYLPTRRKTPTPRPAHNTYTHTQSPNRASQVKLVVSSDAVESWLTYEKRERVEKRVAVQFVQPVLRPRTCVWNQLPVPSVGGPLLRAPFRSHPLPSVAPTSCSEFINQLDFRLGIEIKTLFGRRTFRHRILFGRQLFGRRAFCHRLLFGARSCVSIVSFI